MTTYNTGNPLGSSDPRDLYDNAENLDEAVNSDELTFKDRFGKTKPTLMSAIDPTGLVHQAVDAADRAETARDAAFVNADVYPDVATGRAAVADGAQFQVVEGYEIVRYRRDSAGTQTEVARYPSANLKYRLLVEGVDFERSPNLFNPDTVTLGVVIDASGEIVPNEEYTISDFIEVKPNKLYSKWAEVGPSFLSVAEYDANKQFIKRDYWRDTSYQMSPDTRYIRLNYNTQNGASWTTPRMMVEGVEIPEYVEYGVKLKSLANHSISPEKTTFMERSPNLFNPDTVTLGVVIDASGEIVPNEEYTISDFIEVKPNKLYSKWAEVGQAFASVAEYDANKQFIKRNYWLDLNYQTTSETRYVRLNYTNGLGSSWSTPRMMVEGTVVPEYSGYGMMVRGGYPTHKEIVRVFENLTPAPPVKLLLDMPIDGVFSTAETYPEIGNFTANTSAQVYAMFDDLVAEFPSYITKQNLGDDDFGNHIAVYRFAPVRPPSAAGNARRPRIFIVGGIHGEEKEGTLATYLMVNDMCKKWRDYPLLEALRFNVELLVIPVANPSGWERSWRHNDNGVDINRNFPDDWTLGVLGSQTYGGPEPFSEPEARYIAQVMTENQGIDAFYDFHSFPAREDTAERFLWIPTSAGNPVRGLAKLLIQRMSRKWQSEHSWLPSDDDWFSGYTDSIGGGMAQNYAFTTHGIKLSGVFEVSRGWYLQPGWERYNTEHKRAIVDALVNWLLINIQGME